MRLSIALVALAGLTFGPQPAGHTRQSQGFRASTDAIPVHVSVVDNDGSPVAGLELGDFIVLDGAKPPRVVGFSESPGPLALRLLFADTRRARSHRPHMLAAARQVIADLRPEERLALDAWGPAAMSPFATDTDALAKVLDLLMSYPADASDSAIRSWHSLQMSVATFRIKQDGRLPRYAWIGAGSSAWSPGPSGSNPAVIVFSTGMDETLGVFPDQPQLRRIWLEGAKLAARTGVAVFGIALEGARRDDELRKVTEESGGWFVSRRGPDLTAEVARILRDLRGRYVIALEPSSFDGADRRLEVRVKRSGVTVRARQFYRAPSPPK